MSPTSVAAPRFVRCAPLHRKMPRASTKVGDKVCIRPPGSTRERKKAILFPQPLAWANEPTPLLVSTHPSQPAHSSQTADGSPRILMAPRLLGSNRATRIRASSLGSRTDFVPKSEQIHRISSKTHFAVANGGCFYTFEGYSTGPQRRLAFASGAFAVCCACFSLEPRALGGAHRHATKFTGTADDAAL
jgi:hypothetical protein